MVFLRINYFKAPVKMAIQLTGIIFISSLLSKSREKGIPYKNYWKKD